MLEILELRIAPATLASVFRLSNARPPDSSAVIAADATGNVIVVGKFFAAQFEGTGLGTIDKDGDLFIAKYAPDDTRLWIRKWGGTGAEVATGVAFDETGDVFVTGGFSSVGANFDGPGGGISAVGNQDAFLIKINGNDGTADIAFDGDGNLRWGGNDPDPLRPERAASLVVDAAGAVIVAGSFSSANAGFGGPTTIAADAIDGFVFKVNATSGAPVIAFGNAGMVRYGGAGGENDNLVRVVADSSNDLFLAGVRTNAGVGEITELVKLSGADGAPVANFGNAGSLQLVPPHNPTAFTGLNVVIDSADRVVAAFGVDAGSTSVFRVDRLNGAPDPTFAGGTFATLNFNVGKDMRLNVDSQGQIVVSGNSVATGLASLGRVQNTGVAAPAEQITATTALFETIDGNDNLILRGTYAGNPDLDPTNGVLKLPARSAAQLGAGMSEGYLVRLDPYGVDARNPLALSDATGDDVSITFTGAGRAHYTLVGGVVNGADIATLDLIGTDLTSKLTVTVPTQNTTVGHILTRDPQQHMGSITLGPGVIFGDATDDALPDLRVSGKLNKLVLDDVVTNTFIRLGDGLPYNVTANTTTPDTYNNRPDVTIGDVLGTGVRINVIGDGVTPLGPGGGGLGKVVIGSWAFPGFIRTTQSMGDFTVLTGDFFATLQVDSNLGVHLGSNTNANCGRMRIAQGAWGSSGSEIEGNVASFDAAAFLAGATLTAASMGMVNVSGDFEGMINLTDPDAPALPTFTVATDFVGTVISASPLRKIKIKGDFRGSLEAPFIGSITAYAFIGARDGMDEPTKFIRTTEGSLGTVTATFGGITDYKVETFLAFKGFKVSLTNLTQDTIGIDNVRVTATSIGPTTVSLKAAPTATALDLIGIRDSVFTTTASGDTRATAGGIGAVSVTLAGAAGGVAAVGIQDSIFDALVGTLFSATSTMNALGNVSVKISGQNGINLGIDHSDFLANSIGTITVNVSRHPNLLLPSTAGAIDAAAFSATGAIGAMNVSGDATTAQVKDLEVWAGRTVGAVTVKAKDAAKGTLADSAILAGQLLALTGTTAAEQLAKLALAKLGAVNVSGSITNTDLVAGSSIGAVTVGKDATDSLFLAGATLGNDFVLGGGNDAFQRAASIAAITVKNTFGNTSIAAGVNPGNTTFGDLDDIAAAIPSMLTQSSFIGAISLPAGTLTSASGTYPHSHAIEAAVLNSVKLGINPAVQILAGAPHFIDAAPPNEGPGDVSIRLI